MGRDTKDYVQQGRHSPQAKSTHVFRKHFGSLVDAFDAATKKLAAGMEDAEAAAAAATLEFMLSSLVAEAVQVARSSSQYGRIGGSNCWAAVISRAGTGEEVLRHVLTAGMRVLVSLYAAMTDELSTAQQKRLRALQPFLEQLSADDMDVEPKPVALASCDALLRVGSERFAVLIQSTLREKDERQYRRQQAATDLGGVLLLQGPSGVWVVAGCDQPRSAAHFDPKSVPGARLATTVLELALCLLELLFHEKLTPVAVAADDSLERLLVPHAAVISKATTLTHACGAAMGDLLLGLIIRHEGGYCVCTHTEGLPSGLAVLASGRFLQQLPAPLLSLLLRHLAAGLDVSNNPAAFAAVMEGVAGMLEGSAHAADAAGAVGQQGPGQTAAAAAAADVSPQPSTASGWLHGGGGSSVQRGWLTAAAPSPALAPGAAPAPAAAAAAGARPEAAAAAGSLSPGLAATLQLPSGPMAAAPPPLTAALKRGSSDPGLGQPPPASQPTISGGPSVGPVPAAAAAPDAAAALTLGALRVLLQQRASAAGGAASSNTDATHALMRTLRCLQHVAAHAGCDDALADAVPVATLLGHVSGLLTSLFNLVSKASIVPEQAATCICSLAQLVQLAEVAQSSGAQLVQHVQQQLTAAQRQYAGIKGTAAGTVDGQRAQQPGLDGEVSPGAADEDAEMEDALPAAAGPASVSAAAAAAAPAAVAAASSTPELQESVAGLRLPAEVVTVLSSERTRQLAGHLRSLGLASQASRQLDSPFELRLVIKQVSREVDELLRLCALHAQLAAGRATGSLAALKAADVAAATMAAEATAAGAGGVSGGVQRRSARLQQPLAAAAAAGGGDEAGGGTGTSARRGSTRKRQQAAAATAADGDGIDTAAASSSAVGGGGMSASPKCPMVIDAWDADQAAATAAGFPRDATKVPAADVRALLDDPGPLLDRERGNRCIVQLGQQQQQQPAAFYASGAGSAELPGLSNLGGSLAAGFAGGLGLPPQLQQLFVPGAAGRQQGGFLAWDISDSDATAASDTAADADADAGADAAADADADADVDGERGLVVAQFLSVLCSGAAPREQLSKENAARATAALKLAAAAFPPLQQPAAGGEQHQQQQQQHVAGMAIKPWVAMPQQQMLGVTESLCGAAKHLAVDLAAGGVTPSNLMTVGAELWQPLGRMGGLPIRTKVFEGVATTIAPPSAQGGCTYLPPPVGLCRQLAAYIRTNYRQGSIVCASTLAVTRGNLGSGRVDATGRKNYGHNPKLTGERAGSISARCSGSLSTAAFYGSEHASLKQLLERVRELQAISTKISSSSQQQHEEGQAELQLLVRRGRAPSGSNEEQQRAAGKQWLQAQGANLRSWLLPPHVQAAGCCVLRELGILWNSLFVLAVVAAGASPFHANGTAGCHGAGSSGEYLKAQGSQRGEAVQASLAQLLQAFSSTPLASVDQLVNAVLYSRTQVGRGLALPSGGHRGSKLGTDATRFLSTQNGVAVPVARRSGLQYRGGKGLPDETRLKLRNQVLLLTGQQHLLDDPSSVQPCTPVQLQPMLLQMEVDAGAAGGRAAKRLWGNSTVQHYVALLEQQQQQAGGQQEAGAAAASAEPAGASVAAAQQQEAGGQQQQQQEGGAAAASGAPVQPREPRRYSQLSAEEQAMVVGLGWRPEAMPKQERLT